jgi:hypothetical protein
MPSSPFLGVSLIVHISIIAGYWIFMQMQVVYQVVVYEPL